MRIALVFSLILLLTAVSTGQCAEFDFPFLPEAQKNDAHLTAKSCDRVELSAAQKSACYSAALSGYAGSATYYFEKALKNLPADVRTQAWGRCKAMASDRHFDYVEGALACQNVVAYIFRERFAAKKDVSSADLHASRLLLAFAMRIAQLSILAHDCYDSTKGCVTERQNALGALPDLAELGDNELFPYDPDKPPVPPKKPVPKKKPAKTTLAEAKKVLGNIDNGTKTVKENSPERPCPPEQAVKGWTFDPFAPSGGSGTPGGVGVGVGVGPIDVTKPFFPPGFDYFSLGGKKPGGSEDNSPRVIDHTVNPKDPAGLGAGLDAMDRYRGVAPARLPGAVSAVRDAAGTAGPDRGSAVFVLSTDGSGRVVNVSVQGGGSDSKKWEELIPAIKATLSNTRARMKDGASGMRVSIAVEAEHRNPSGTLEGKKTSAPALGPGTVSVTFDLSDIGAKATRQIRVRQLDEQTLY